jgi:hypothetical protein
VLLPGARKRIREFKNQAGRVFRNDDLGIDGRADSDFYLGTVRSACNVNLADFAGSVALCSGQGAGAEHQEEENCLHSYHEYLFQTPVARSWAYPPLWHW